MIVRTEAVVIRSMVYGETSRIATLFTRDMGKLSVIAKGARRPKSKFGSTLQVLSIVQAVFYYRGTRSLQVLSECTHTIVPKLDDLARLTAAIRMVELTNALMPEEEEHPEVFDLLVAVLVRLQGVHSSAALLQLHFEMQLAAAMGFAPDFEREAVRTLPSSGGILHFESGTIKSDGETGPNAVKASRTALRAFATMARAHLDVISGLPAPPLAEVRRLVSQYMRFHVADAYPERAQKILQHMMRTP